MNKEITNREFVKILKQAVDADISAIYKIIDIYAGAIVKNSTINGRYNQECRDYIEEKIIKNIKKFKKIWKFLGKSDKSFRHFSIER